MTDSNQDWFVLIFVSIPIGCMVLYLAQVLYTRLQASILELLVTLTVSSIPLGLILQNISDEKEVLKWIVAGLFPMILFFAGSLWGLSICKRLNEQYSPKRLAFIVLGWFMVSGVAVVPVTFGFMMKYFLTFRYADPSDAGLTTLGLLFGLCNTLLFILGIHFEWKSRRPKSRFSSPRRS